MTDKRNNKNRINMHAMSMTALVFILVLLLIEIMVIIYQVITDKIVDTNDFYTIMLYVIPALSAVLTSVLIYVNHRTFQISNKLTDGLSKIADGDYNVEIPYKKLDGFNGVYANFNKMAEELKSVKTLREDFVHNFSHEFKTPISSINGFAKLLLEGGLSEEEQKNILKIIAAESERLSRLSENALLLSRVENQQFIGERKNYRLDTQLKECVIMLERQWAEKDITISSELPSVTYAGDEQLMQQLWLNLLSNAIKYTPTHGEITINLTQAAGDITVSIADNGIGIAEEDLPKIFDKYYQAKSTRSGNGLGLAICKRIVSLCGGDIRAESIKGEGSTFIVRL
jgi:signal transduction histidine kinase